MLGGCDREIGESRDGGLVTSTSLPKHVLHCFGMLGDHGQQHARGRVGVSSALFPVPERRWRETEPGCELRLAESYLQPDLTHIDFWHAHQRHAHVVALAPRPRDGFLQSLDDALVYDLPLGRCSLQCRSGYLFARSCRIPSTSSRTILLRGGSKSGCG